MIRRVHLANWRAYERLDLDLVKPVTFVVAPNGVGKTSLIEAVKWATFGRAPSVERGRAVRVGAKEATVELTIALPSGSTINVARSLTTSGKSTFLCSLDGDDISESEYMRLLSDAWAADPDLLLSLLFGEAGAQASSAFPIRDHLAEVFGISPLIEGISTIDERRKALSREIKNLRAEHGVDGASIREAEEDVQRLRADARGTDERVTGAKAKAEELGQVESSAAAWEQYRSHLAGYQQQTAALIESLNAVLDVGEGDPETLVARAEDEAMTQLNQYRAAVSQAQVSAASAGSALDLLSEEPDVCPTCLRRLSDEERTTAVRHHQAERGEATESVDAHHEEADEAEQRLFQVRQISRSLRSVRVPTPPDFPDPGPEAAEQSTIAEQKLLEATEEHGAAIARLTDAERRLSTLRESAEENAALVAAYKEETILQITGDALSAVVDRYMTERIEPLTDEVSRRWKVLFGSEGLRLDHDGSLSFQIGGDHLELSDLSGGERVVALFVTRLLVVASATRATTLWLDEPLEHLDPRRRGAVARTVVRAAQQRALEQVVVTTYEERLVRQLAATAPQVVGVAHVRPEPRG
jgi:DNA repair exonuclease SbcCD ATPase subunit